MPARLGRQLLANEYASLPRDRSDSGRSRPSCCCNRTGLAAPRPRAEGNLKRCVCCNPSPFADNRSHLSNSEQGRGHRAPVQLHRLGVLKKIACLCMCRFVCIVHTCRYAAELLHRNQDSLSLLTRWSGSFRFAMASWSSWSSLGSGRRLGSCMPGGFK